MVVDAVFHIYEYGAEVSVARMVPSSVNCTPATPLACPEPVEGSDAVAVMFVVLETVELLAGAVRETCGGVVSVVVAVFCTLTLSVLVA